MNYALIKDGIVKNIIVADSNFVDLIKSKWDFVVDVTTNEEAGVGWLYDGKNFIIPHVAEATVESAPEVPVSERVPVEFKNH
jgi:hypothetical protein